MWLITTIAIILFLTLACMCSCTCRELYISYTTDYAKYTYYEGQLSLDRDSSNASSNSEGRLKVYLNGKWTFVCNEMFGDDEAESSCKQLGYAGYISYDDSYDVHR